MSTHPAHNSRARRLYRRGAALAAILSALLFIVLENTPPLRWLETGTYDARMRWSLDAAKADKSIVIVDVDNPSFEILKDNFGRWPWSRMVWAGAIDYLADQHPKVIAFDFKFSGSEDPKVDQSFASSITSARNVLLAYSFDSAKVNDDQQLRNRQLALLSQETQPSNDLLGETFDPAEESVNVPLDILARAAAGLGCIDAVFDSDGAVRRMPLGCNFGNQAFRSLDTRIVDFAHGRDESRFRRAGRYAVSDSAKLPVDEAGRLLLWFSGDPREAYTRVPFWKLVCSAEPSGCKQFKDPISPGYFKDKIVLVGVSASGSFDLHPTPVGNAPGVFDHAVAIDNLLHGDGVRVAPRWIDVALIGLLAFVGWFVLKQLSTGLKGTLTILVCLGLYIAMTTLVFRLEHLWLPMVAPLATGVLSYVAAGAVRYATTGRELRRTRDALDRYMSKQLVQFVLDRHDEIDFAGQRRELTIFFSDIRSFTTLTEGLRDRPEQLLSLLNEYLAAMTEIIFKYEGVVDKFIGDGILAHWGAFTEGNHALLAAKASLEMLDRLQTLNDKWEGEGRQKIAIGIGLNSGEVTFGNVGAGKKIEFTIIGDPVNLAARLESLNKDHGTSIIISEYTAAHLEGLAAVKPLGSVKVKGKTIETQIFELQALTAQPAFAGETHVTGAGKKAHEA